MLRPGDEVVVLPSGRRTKIAGIDTFDGPVEEAFPPMSVALRLEDDIDVSRGSTIARAQNQPTVSSSFECPAVLDVRAAAEPEQALSGQAHHPDRGGQRRRVRYRIDLDATAP